MNNESKLLWNIIIVVASAINIGFYVHDIVNHKVDWTICVSPLIVLVFFNSIYEIIKTLKDDI